MLKESVTIPGMPEIWESEITFLPSRVAGSFAKWAVEQSPYAAPVNLTEAVLAVDEFAKSWCDGAVETVVTLTCHEIRRRLEKFFDETPVIESWNHPKSGREQPFYGCDRNGPWQEPDDDIIDLSALARNIAHDLTLGEVYRKVND